MGDGLVLHEPGTYAKGFPHEYFRRLRESDPITHHDHPIWEQGYWAVVRHPDVQRISRDSETFHNAPHPFLDNSTGTEEVSSGLLISLDGADHRMVFGNQRQVTDGRPRPVERRVDGLLDLPLQVPGHGH